jgi:glycosyltransferase involved in cell wall biosynthesis
MSPPAHHRTLALHDPTRFGHGPTFVGGLVVAGLAHGDDVRAVSPIEPRWPAGAEAPEGWSGWFPYELPDQQFGPDRRRALSALRSHAGVADADGLVITTMEQYLSSYGARLTLPTPTVVVMHNVHTLVREANVRQRARREITRSGLRAVARSGGAILVPARNAAEVIRRAVPVADVRVVPFPVLSASELAAQAAMDDGPGGGAETGEVRVLFPGEARDDKGFPMAVEALGGANGVDVLEVSGRVSSGGYRALAAAGDRAGKVELLAELGSDQADYEAAFGRATLALMPMTEEYRANGRISSTLLDAVAHGLPVVTTPAARDVVPAGFEGAVVAERSDAGALAEAISWATAHVDELRAAARRTGPVVMRDHTYEAYWTSLLRALDV